MIKRYKLKRLQRRFDVHEKAMDNLRKQRQADKDADETDHFWINEAIGNAKNSRDRLAIKIAYLQAEIEAK